MSEACSSLFSTLKSRCLLSNNLVPESFWTDQGESVCLPAWLCLCSNNNGYAYPPISLLEALSSSLRKTEGKEKEVRVFCFPRHKLCLNVPAPQLPSPSSISAQFGGRGVLIPLPSQNEVRRSASLCNY